MTEKQEIQKMLEIYKEAYKECETSDTPLDVCKKYGLYSGICNLINTRSIYASFKHKHLWVNELPSDEDGFIFTPPCWCTSKSKIMQSLEFRINALKTELENRSEEVVNITQE